MSTIFQSYLINKTRINYFWWYIFSLIMGGWGAITARQYIQMGFENSKVIFLPQDLPPSHNFFNYCVFCVSCQVRIKIFFWKCCLRHCLSRSKLADYQHDIWGSKMTLFQMPWWASGLFLLRITMIYCRIIRFFWVLQVVRWEVKLMLVSRWAGFQ